jgi:uncharacterized protein YbgA (DUF1722 family)/uncharacterized protein YbbK (DUF523 family)
VAAFAKPIVVVSACLGFRACRYDGAILPDAVVERLKSWVEFRPVCPEMEIGLGVPRDPLRVVEDRGRRMLYQPSTGRDLAAALVEFAGRFLDGQIEIDGFLLKSRSPSCGLKDAKIYRGTRPDAAFRRGAGFFGAAVRERFPGLPAEDEVRLASFSLREYFLIRLFLLAELRTILRAPSMRELIGFHERHRLLLMGHGPRRIRALGRILAGHGKGNPTQVGLDYARELRLALSKPPPYTALINALQHAFGGLSDSLSAQERRYFLNALQEYRGQRVPLSVPLRLLEDWALRQNDRYLMGQSLLHPYPREMADISDSGKGRDL